MTEARQGETDILELSDLDVTTVGLVRRGANGQPFFFIKSMEGTSMEDELRDQEAPEVEPEVEPASEPAGEAFAARVKELEEKFNAELAAERKLREEFAEKYTEERRARQLEAFSDQVERYAFGVEKEKFAEDLLTLQELNADLAERFTQRFDAIDAQMREGQLFAQTARAGGESSETDPFLRKVEAVRAERFSDLPYAEGVNKALDVVSSQNRELALDYVHRGRE